MAASFADSFEELVQNVAGYVLGANKTVRLALVCLIAEGHLLIEGVPGVAKTSLAKAIAQSVGGLSHRRIQFTPDLLPSDVTGARMPQEGGVLEFEPGPVFCNVLVADEINRASPKTQSALLEVMAERRVTTDGVTRAVGSPFLCIATQNPIEYQGTYTLPEAQLDRFMMRLTMGYPETADECRVVAGALGRPAAVDDTTPDGPDGARLVGPAFGRERLVELIRHAHGIYVAGTLQRYVVDLVAQTRDAKEDGVLLGASPRAAIALAAAARAHAASKGGDFTTAQDVKEVAIPVLAHRLIMDADAWAPSDAAADFVQAILDRTQPPKESEVERPR